MKTQIPNWLDRMEYPFEPQTFRIGDVKMNYIDEGSGEVLLFVHGTPSWSFDFRHLIKAFSNGYRCIALDHVGFGLSDKPENYHYTPLQHSQNLKALIEYIDLKDVTLIVHDFGGPIGFHYAIHNALNIKRLIVLNTWLWNSENQPEFKKMKPILKSPLLPVLYKYLNFSAKFLLPGSFGDKNKLSKAVHKQYISPFGKSSERLGTLGFARSLLNDQSWFESLWQQKAALVHKPTLFIWGMADKFITPDYLYKFMEAFTGADVCKLEGVGHFPQEETPEEVINAIGIFLVNEDKQFTANQRVSTAHANAH